MIHLLAVALWSFSTAVAYIYYVAPAFRAWERHPRDAGALARRNEFMERFDRGAIIEHVAFPLLLATGVLLVWLAGWSWREVNWLGVKLGIVLLVFVPMEIIDYYISHFGGNKRRIRHSGNPERYEAMTRFHWLFFRVSTPLVMIFVPILFYFAVAKPI